MPTENANALPERLRLSDEVMTSDPPQHTARPVDPQYPWGYVRIIGEREYAEEVVTRYNAHAALVAERDRLREALKRCRELVGKMDAWNDTRDEIELAVDDALTPQ